MTKSRNSNFRTHSWKSTSHNSVKKSHNNLFNKIVFIQKRASKTPSSRGWEILNKFTLLQNFVVRVNVSWICSWEIHSTRCRRNLKRSHLRVWLRYLREMFEMLIPKWSKFLLPVSAFLSAMFQWHQKLLQQYISFAWPQRGLLKKKKKTDSDNTGRRLCTILKVIMTSAEQTVLSLTPEIKK